MFDGGHIEGVITGEDGRVEAQFGLVGGVERDDGCGGGDDGGGSIDEGVLELRSEEEGFDGGHDVVNVGYINIIII